MTQLMSGRSLDGDSNGPPPESPSSLGHSVSDVERVIGCVQFPALLVFLTQPCVVQSTSIFLALWLVFS